MKNLRTAILLLLVGALGSTSVMFYIRYSVREQPQGPVWSLDRTESSLDSVNLAQHEAGKLKWVLNSKKAEVFDGESLVELKGVDLLIVTDDDGRMQITGERGKYSRENGDFRIEGNVKIVSGDEFVLFSNAVRWDIGNNMIISDGSARAVGPHGAITGKNMTIDVQKQKIFLYENVNASLN